MNVISIRAKVTFATGNIQPYVLSIGQIAMLFSPRFAKEIDVQPGSDGHYTIVLKDPTAEGRHEFELLQGQKLSITFYSLFHQYERIEYEVLYPFKIDLVE